ncbi:MAG: glutamate--tRNA ligase [Actinomycetota bacterium]|nr:MAG: glutamate--tRNA ligase [Actinomycetota bacterium]
MKSTLRVRFAPSPTGYFHVGGARTALYNWLIARKAGGSFVLRIEDTDEARNAEEWVEGILSALTWLGISWDEGPYRQSERSELYARAVARLIDEGNAYWCGCTRDEIDQRVKERGGPPGYDGYCRNRNNPRTPDSALRFKIPRPGQTVVHDKIRGDVVFDHENLDDFIIVKSNGSPLFVLANVVDDMDMKISYILRAEEHLPTTPKAILLFQALGMEELPVFAHVPVLVNAKRQKLSKRRDRVAVEDYREMGYLASAMVNYLVLLGWSPGGDREFMTIEEMIELFDIDQVNHSPAFFDEKKMQHFNGVYIRELSADEFVNYCLPFLEKNDWWQGSVKQLEVFSKIAPLVQERVSLLSEASGMVGFLFQSDIEISSDLADSVLRKDPKSAQIISDISEIYLNLSEFKAEQLHDATRRYCDSIDTPLRKVQAPIRVALTGSKVGPPLFESIELLGKKATLQRLVSAGELIGIRNT